MFNTPAADKILAALQVFPPDNPWNEDISRLPVRANSKDIIATAGAAHRISYDLDMSFILVPPKQKKVKITLGFAEESDPGPFPIPDNAPIELWPLNDKRKLEDIQTAKEEGDRHVIVVDPVNAKLYEMFMARKVKDGWDAMTTAVFDLKSNKLRPDGWTSTDAAGLPIFPALYPLR